MPTQKQKKSRDVVGHPYRKKKRQFAGNRFTAECDTEQVSTSATKLKETDYDCVGMDPSVNYVILHFMHVFTALSTFVKCQSCDGEIKFTKTNGAGVAFKIVASCSCSTHYCDSSPKSHKCFEVNRRLMLAIRMLGGGLQSLRIFCALMDITSSFSTKIYYAFIDNLHTASYAVFQYFQKKAVAEEIEQNVAAGKHPTLVTVSGDGSWKKRGFSSLFGFSTLIGKNTNKVLDISVKSSFCQACSNWKNKTGTPEYDLWKETHAEICSANHHGSAGKMEVDAITEMFTRSVELLGVKYDSYIGDGDTKTFKAIIDMNPYDDLVVKKKECVGHVQKRMGTRLRAVKKQTKGLGGKGSGKLTDKVIADLTTYYGLAIRRHSESAEDMKNAVWAVYYHNISTDKKPQHDYCPAGEDSWCKWRVAEACGSLKTFKHKPALADNVQAAIKPVFEALSTDDLMERCTGGNTQNSNESVNACVWKLSPKHLHCGAKTVEIAAYTATAMFNEGYIALLKIMDVLRIPIGLEMNNFARAADEKRVAAAESSMSVKAKAAALSRKSDKTSLQAEFELEEGLMYGPGIAD